MKSASSHRGQCASEDAGARQSAAWLAYADLHIIYCLHINNVKSLDFLFVWLERDTKTLFYLSKVGKVKEIRGKMSRF